MKFAWVALLTGLLLSVSKGSQLAAVHALPALATQQTVVTGDDIQTMINIALVTGQTSVTLPNTRIYVSRTIRLPAGTKNFAIRGQANTVLQRTVNTDFVILQIGDNSDIGYGNAFLDQNFVPKPVLPLTYLNSTVTTADGSNLPTGYYALVSNNLFNDSVLHVNGVNRVWFKRELVRVIASANGTSTLGGTVGRDFENPVMYPIQPDGAFQGRVCENITLENFVVDGRVVVREAGRNIVYRTTRVNNAVVVGPCLNLTMNGVKVKGFNNSGVSIELCRGVNVSNCSITDGNATQLGYGFEVSGSRFVNFTDCQFSNHRWGVLWAAGSSDGNVTRCIVADTPNSGLDCSHGQGEQRLVYTDCIANIFSIGNPAYLRGVTSVRLQNCTARQSINIYPNADLIYIVGKHPTMSMTSPMISLLSESTTTGLPTGNHVPKRVYLQNGISSLNTGASNPMQLHSLSNAQKSVEFVEARQWIFTNNFTDSSNAYRIGGSAFAPVMKFIACQFRNKAPYEFPVYVTSGPWNWTFEGCQFFKDTFSTTAYEKALRLGSTTSGTITMKGFNVFYSPNTPTNGRHINNLSYIQNDGTATVNFVP